MSSSENFPNTPPDQQQKESRKSSGQQEEGKISPQRKRERESNQGAAVGSGSRPRRKGELDVSNLVEPICYVCKKRFASWKAVFGHLRAHPRDQPGAFPPPRFTRDDGAGAPNLNSSENNNIAEQLGRERVETIGQGQNQSNPPDLAADAVSGRKGLDIDLNEPVEGEESLETEKNGGIAAGFDLNKPPKDSEEDGAAN